MSSDVRYKLVSLGDIENGWKWIKEDCISKQIDHEETRFVVTRLVNYSSYQLAQDNLKEAYKLRCSHSGLLYHTETLLQIVDCRQMIVRSDL